VYGGQNQEWEAAYLQIAERMKERFSGGRRPLKVLVQKDDELDEKQWRELPSFLIGTPSSNKLIKRISTALPFKQGEKGFQVKNILFQDTSDVFQLSFFPNPDSMYTPMNLLSGNSDEAVLEILNTMLGGRRFRLWGSLPYQVFEDGEKTAMGDFDENWNFDPELSWYFDPNPQVAYEQANLQIYSHNTQVSDAELKNYGSKVLQGFQRITDFWGKDPMTSALKLNLYGSPEIMGMMTGDMQLSYAKDESDEVHKLAHEYFPGVDESVEYSWALAQVATTPKIKAFSEGLSIYFSENWQRKGYKYWASKLTKSKDWRSLSDIITGFSDYDSPIVRRAMSAAMVDFLLDEWGQELFKEKYAAWEPSKKELKVLEKKWINYLMELARSEEEEKRKVELPDFLKGMTFAHEGYSVYNGYGSTLAKKSLKQIRDHHANMISIVPYSGLRETHKPMPIGISNGAGGENDISVAFASKAAQSMGMKTMMKPQIWFGRAWPGDLEMQSQEDWDQFFVHYRRWILHYTLLAEIHEFDMLCLGVEFVKASTQQPKAWAELARDMKQIFSGKITYAANWGEEIENMSPELSSNLDFLGLDCYYPLSQEDELADKELEEGFQKTLRKLKKISERHAKPMIFTEIGFRSIPAAWKEPHASAKDDRAMEEDQARCYEAVLTSIKGQDWHKGMIWWKWPSYMDYGNRSPQSFTPAAKKAAEVLKKYYRLEEF
ncbi:MAG: hypothetical protein AAF696_24120, partial [Bacteroidota bacterium]